MEFFVITTASDGVCARRAAHIVVVIVLLILRTWKMLVQRLKYTEAVKLLRDTRCNDCFTHKIGMRKCFTSTSVLYHLWSNNDNSKTVQALTLILAQNGCSSQHAASQPLSVFIASNSPWSIKVIHNTLWLLFVVKDAIF